MNPLIVFTCYLFLFLALGYEAIALKTLPCWARILLGLGSVLMAIGALGWGAQWLGYV
jgi:hypothetical protein